MENVMVQKLLTDVLPK